MALSMPVYGKKAYGRKTEAAGTKIVRGIEPMIGAVTHIQRVAVTTSTTAHILTVLKPINKTTVAIAAAAAQAVINITADPGNFTGIRTADNGIAASDWCAYQCIDGTWVFDTVASVATLAITMTTNVPTSGVAAGAPFWFYGIETDTNPCDATVHARHTLTASTTNVFGTYDADLGWHGSIQAANSTLFAASLLHADMKTGKDQPLILVVDNGTAASTIEEVIAFYSDRATSTTNFGYAT